MSKQFFVAVSIQSEPGSILTVDALGGAVTCAEITTTAEPSSIVTESVPCFGSFPGVFTLRAGLTSSAVGGSTTSLTDDANIQIVLVGGWEAHC